MSTRTKIRKVVEVTCDHCDGPIRVDLQTDYYQLKLMAFVVERDVRGYAAKVTEDFHVSCLQKRILGQREATESKA